MSRTSRLACLSGIAGGILILLLVAASGRQAPQPPAPSVWVVAVGINAYRDTSIVPLNYAVADARAVADLFRRLGVPPDHIAQVVTEEGSKGVTRDAITAQAQNILARAAPQDTLVFFFSGHGLGGTAAGDGPYLATSDCDFAAPRDTALSIDSLRDVVYQARVHKVIFLLDCCRNSVTRGAAGPAGGLASGTAIQKKLEVMPATGEKEVFVLFGCRDGKTSMELPELGHGVFTWALLDALRGKARSPSGLLTADGVADYVIDAVTQRSDGNQVPRKKIVTQGADVGQFVLARNVPPAQYFLAETRAVKSKGDAEPKVDSVALGARGVALPQSVSFRGQAIYQVPADYKQFIAALGRSDKAGPAKIRYRVTLDGTEAASGDVPEAGSQPQEVRVKLNGQRLMALDLQCSEEGFDPYGVVWWGDARFTDEEPKDAGTGVASRVNVNVLCSERLRVNSWDLLVDDELKKDSAEGSEHNVSVSVTRGGEHRFVFRWRGGGASFDVKELSITGALTSRRVTKFGTGELRFTVKPDAAAADLAIRVDVSDPGPVPFASPKLVTEVKLNGTKVNTGK